MESKQPAISNRWSLAVNGALAVFDFALDNQGRSWTGTIKFQDSNGNIYGNERVKSKQFDEQIKKVEIYKLKLISSVIKKYAFHAVLLVYTTRYVYSIEKTTEDLVIQQDIETSSVLNRRLNEERNKKEDSYILDKEFYVNPGTTMQNIIDYIKNNETKVGYKASIIDKNCIGFVNRLLKQMKVNYEIDGTEWINLAQELLSCGKQNMLEWLKNG